MLEVLTIGMEATGAAASGDASWFTADAMIALLTLTALEIVLGIDNVVFITILTGKLPEHQRAFARRLGLGLAMGMRIVLLFFISWIMQLDTPLFEVPFLTESAGAGHGTGHGGGDGAVEGAGVAGGDASVPMTISGRDLVVLLGGLFLLAKATYELHHQVMGHKPRDRAEELVASGADGKGGAAAGAKAGAKAGVKAAGASFSVVIVQILLLDLVFSVDSVLTAVGMAKQLWVMVTAVVISVAIMMIFAGPVSRFVEAHPTMKVLALAFLVLIGVLLLAEGLGQHIPRGYVYFAMAFALVVDLLQLRADKARSVHDDGPDD